MNRNIKLLLIAAMILTLSAALGCKSSGRAVSSEGHVINANIVAPSDLSEGETEEVKVTVTNRGFNKLSAFVMDVEMPTELIVISQTQSPGVEWTERVTAGGQKAYRYTVNEISVGSKAEVNYHVRAAFGSRNETGDLKVTAWSEQLPGDRLIETKRIRLRR